MIVRVVLVALIAFSSMISGSGLDSLPVLYKGRLQPFSSVARSSLVLIHEKSSFSRQSEAGSEKVSAVEWLWDVVTHSPASYMDPVFLIHDSDIKYECGFLVTQKNFSFKQLQPFVVSFHAKARAYRQKEASQRNSYERNVIQLSEKLFLFTQLGTIFIPYPDISFKAYLDDYLAQVEPGLSLFQFYNKHGYVSDESEQLSLLAFMDYFKQHRHFSDQSGVLLFPDVGEPLNQDKWRNTGSELLAHLDVGHVTHPLLTQWAALGELDYGSEAFLEGAQTLSSEYQAFLGSQLRRVSAEAVFNRVNPFMLALYMYGGVLLLSFLFFLRGNDRVFVFSKWLIWGAFLLHTVGLIARLYITGRPPVTNLYSSAVFIGWVGIVLCFIQERFFKNKLGYFLGAILGIATLIIAYHLSLQSDSMDVLQAVLDSNFWLSTHVITITLGYSGTFLAGIIATVYCLGAVFDRLSPVLIKELVKMVYGIICFSLFFSFVGTVLGGIWADQSWGRFWGWDPKENGALLIVIWNALILHSRMSGLVQTKGLMMLAIFGNVVTAFSWFGVNMLGVGLHSYGFMHSAFNALVLYCLAQVALIFVGFNYIRSNDR